jgi:hypothetical protein
MVLAQETKNRFFLCLRKNQAPIDVSTFDFNSDQLNAKPDLVYFGKALAYVKNNLKATGLIFYITWDVNHLPSYGDNVVAVLIGDEFYRIPDYAHQVRATFKTYGIRPEFGFRSSHGSLKIIVLNLLQAIRVTALRLPGLAKKILFSLMNMDRPIYDIPAGCMQNLDLPMKDMGARDIDVFFAGSINHTKESFWSPKNWLGGPKKITRDLMMKEIKKIKLAHPDLNIELLETSSFSHSVEVGKELYLRNMMNSKLTLVPRGSALETMRFFESIRYGCVPITEHLPARWFFRGAPAIKVSTWKNLEAEIVTLLSNKERLDSMHERVLNWWDRHCSEDAVGRYIVSMIDV